MTYIHWSNGHAFSFVSSWNQDYGVQRVSLVYLWNVQRSACFHLQKKWRVAPWTFFCRCYVYCSRTTNAAGGGTTWSHQNNSKREERFQKTTLLEKEKPCDAFALDAQRHASGTVTGQDFVPSSNNELINRLERNFTWPDIIFDQENKMATRAKPSNNTFHKKQRPLRMRLPHTYRKKTNFSKAHRRFLELRLNRWLIHRLHPFRKSR